ncbi:hypothetical protein N7510_008503 [Penicillium lagena]|uniref:uncharacterized protein n=1 Tax=Penicillium lagena TaxID=94218 RepID=UPI0025422B80|nr:uncharacterized protein N7510_008503 [Penicillium lagena]KAJ5605722.1 hypothetical protein N7510_008503 [Penicillium lagena]
MPVTELVFPRPNPDPVLFEKLRQVLPTAAKAAFANVLGLFATYRGKIIRAQNISEGKAIEHSGLIIVLEWDEVSSFNKFWVSDQFASFRKTMAPYLLKPVAPDLFHSEEQERSGQTTTANYTQLFKVEGVQGQHEGLVTSTWQKFVSELPKQTKVFHAWGVQDTQHVFAGMVGWDSIEELEAAHENKSVKRELDILATYGEVLSYLLQLSMQS